MSMMAPFENGYGRGKRRTEGVFRDPGQQDMNGRWSISR